MTQKPTESRQSLSIETPEQPEVLRVNPLQALFIALDDINVTLQEVLKELRHRPQGHIMPVSGTASGVLTRHVLTPAWFSFVITNDGPDDLEFLVGEINQPYASLNARETLRIDFSGTLISSISLRAAAKASYRIYGIY